MALTPFQNQSAPESNLAFVAMLHKRPSCVASRKIPQKRVILYWWTADFQVTAAATSTCGPFLGRVNSSSVKPAYA